MVPITNFMIVKDRLPGFGYSRFWVPISLGFYEFCSNFLPYFMIFQSETFFMFSTYLCFDFWLWVHINPKFSGTLTITRFHDIEIGTCTYSIKIWKKVHFLHLKVEIIYFRVRKKIELTFGTRFSLFVNFVLIWSIIRRPNCLLCTSLKVDLRQDIKEGFVFSRCINGTFPWRKCSVKSLVS